MRSELQVAAIAITCGVVLGLAINVALLTFVAYFGGDSVLGGFTPTSRPSPYREAVRQGVFREGQR